MAGNGGPYLCTAADRLMEYRVSRLQVALHTYDDLGRCVWPKLCGQASIGGYPSGVTGWNGHDRDSMQGLEGDTARRRWGEPGAGGLLRHGPLVATDESSALFASLLVFVPDTVLGYQSVTTHSRRGDLSWSRLRTAVERFQLFDDPSEPILSLMGCFAWRDRNCTGAIKATFAQWIGRAPSDGMSSDALPMARGRHQQVSR